MILLLLFEIFAPFGSTKKHSSLPLQIDLNTPCLKTIALCTSFPITYFEFVKEKNRKYLHR